MYTGTVKSAFQFEQSDMVMELSTLPHSLAALGRNRSVLVVAGFDSYPACVDPPRSLESFHFSCFEHTLTTYCFI